MLSGSSLRPMMGMLVGAVDQVSFSTSLQPTLYKGGERIGSVDIYEVE